MVVQNECVGVDCHANKTLRSLREGQMQSPYDIKMQYCCPVSIMLEYLQTK
jgi:hypothetical protein